MAYAALVFLDQEIEKLLPNHNEYTHLYKKRQMKSIHSKVIFLENFLEDFPGKSSLIKNFESRITDVAYEVSDIIGWGLFDGKHCERFKSCIERIDSLVENAKEITKGLEMRTSMLGHDFPTVAELSGKDTMVGLDMDLRQMKERIVRRDSELQIIPITGMGGIGKTTLAKYIYEDPAIVAHFDVRFWVTVSQEHNTEKVLKEILGDTKTKDGEPLIVSVHKKLSGRRFLIIVDDIWSVEAWDSMRNAFQDDNKGSRVVITTRLTEVATKVGSLRSLHEMQLMNEVQSWELFQKEAFGQHERCPPQLEHGGKTISNNCKGLPLAIVVIARHLKLNRTQDYWGNFDRHMKEAMAETLNDHVMKILSLSYHSLPSHLKACFLYTSMFPEDADISTTKLKRLWLAERFLKPREDKSVEQLAEKCLQDLVDRNLLSVCKRSYSGKIRTCSVHDLLRDLSLTKAQEEKFSLQITTLNKVYRRCMDPSNTDISKTKYGYIYSLICHGEFNYKAMLPTMRSKLVRVVDALETPFEHPLSFGVNLRYLAFQYSGSYDDLIATLANVRKLKHLETLIISHHRFFSTLSFPILEMPKLKQFILYGGWHSYGLTDNPVSKKSLLETLSGVRDIIFTTDAVEILANLLKIKFMCAEYNIHAVHLSNLVCLHQLEELYLCMNVYDDDDIEFYTCPLPSNIAFPNKLKKITLCNFDISLETMLVIGSLPNLQGLIFEYCYIPEGEWESIEGGFQQLKYLKLGLPVLKKLNVESTDFPCLEQLVLDGCRILGELPAEIGEINTLQKLIVKHCYYCEDSAREIQEEQQAYGNYQLQVIVL